MKKLFIILFSINMLFATEVKLEDIHVLTKGDVIEDSVDHLEKKYYRVSIKHLKDIHITLTNLSADVDLYVKTDIEDNPSPLYQLLPRIRKNDCYSSNSKNQDEECRYQIVNTQPRDLGATSVYIMVYGIEAGSYTLKVTEEKTEKLKVLDPLASYYNEKVKKGESKQYIIKGKAGQTIETSIYKLTDDADLRMKIGRKANKHTFDCKSTNGGTKNDKCSVTLKEDATVYVEVYGYRAANYAIAVEDSLTDNAIVKLAKNTCLKESSVSTKTIRCIDNTNAYVLTYYQGFDGTKIHKVNMQNNTAKQVQTFDFNYNSSFLDLKNTNLIAVDENSNLGDYMNSITFRNPKTYKQIKILYFGEERDGNNIRISIKTIKQGKELEVVSNDYSDDGYVKYKTLYDISDTSKVTLISHTKI